MTAQRSLHHSRSMTVRTSRVFCRGLRKSTACTSIALRGPARGLVAG
jgi:hypothetical protein